jgi:serine/threonine protein kinase
VQDNLCNLIEVLYSGGHENAMGSSGVDNIYIIHEPLCDGGFRSFIQSTANDTERKTAFCQIASGLAHLHDQGIMHRDIKPGNVMIATRDPLRVVIIDYGHATTEPTSTDHFKGTIAYLAPEVLALKSGDALTPYDKSCDMWALGLVGYQLFCMFKDPSWQAGVNADSYRRILAGLQLLPRDLISLIRGLLTWHPKFRLKAEAVVSLLTQTSDESS